MFSLLRLKANHSWTTIRSFDKKTVDFAAQTHQLIFSGSYSVLLRDKNAAATYINCRSQSPCSSPGQGFDCFSCSLGCSDVSCTENQSLLRQFQYMTSLIQRKRKLTFDPWYLQINTWIRQELQLTINFGQDHLHQIRGPLISSNVNYIVLIACGPFQFLVISFVSNSNGNDHNRRIF